MASKIKLIAAAVAALTIASDFCSAAVAALALPSAGAPFGTPGLPIDTRWPVDGPTRWAVEGGLEIDKKCNVILKVARIPVEASDTHGKNVNDYPMLGVKTIRSYDIASVLYAYRPWDENLSGLIEEAFESEKLAAMFHGDAVCPHSLQIVFENYGTYGQRSLSAGDLAHVVPAKWPADFLVDQQNDRLIVINNKRGSALRFYPGPTINAGVTAWVYSRADGKLLKIKQLRKGEVVITKPGSNVDIARDWVPADQHPHFAKNPGEIARKFPRGFLSFAHAALRTLVLELGLSPEVEKKIRQSCTPKFAGVEYWARNPLSPSANFQVLFMVDDASVLGDLTPSAADKILEAVWMEPDAAEKAAIDGKWELEGRSEWSGNMRMGPSPEGDNNSA